jgi:hypothetical protein
MSNLNRPSQARFTLAGLLELIAGIGLFLALVTQLGAFGVVCALVGLAVILAANYLLFAQDRAAARRNVVSLLIVPAIILAVIALFWLLLPQVYSAREVEQTPCQRNLRTLKLAFMAYETTHGHYPPPFVADASGKPIHSWRALILPYLDADLDQAYDMNEPWDGPHNRQLASRMPEVFRCPSAKRTPPGMTSYFCVVGQGRMTPGATFQKASDFTDDPTILLIESNAAHVNWLEPRDLTVEEVINRGAVADAPPCHHRGEDGGVWRKAPYFNCAMAESFRGWGIRDDIAPQTLKDLLTIDGGEKVDWYDLGPKQHLWSGVWVLLGAEVVFIVCAIIRRVPIARRMRSDVKPA